MNLKTFLLGLSALAAVVAGAVIADLGFAHPRSSWFMVGGLGLALVAFPLVDALVLGWRTPPAWNRLIDALCPAVLILPSLVIGGIHVAPDTMDGPGLWFGANAVAAVIAGGLLHRVRTRLGLEMRDGEPPIALASAVQLSVMMVYLHLREGTFADVHERSTWLHTALLLGSIGASCMWLPLFAARIRMLAGRPIGRAGLHAAVGLMCLCVGVALLELDRRAMVDLHEAVHVWLEIIGILGLQSGVILCVGSFRDRWTSVSDTWVKYCSVAPGLVLLFAIGAYLRPSNLKDLRLRAPISESPYANVVLTIHPAHGSGNLLPADVFNHPSLDAVRVDGPRRDRHFNIVMVTVDALRGDVLGSPDEPLEEAAHMMSFARDATQFRRAYSPGSRTALAMSAVLSGHYSATLDWELWVSARGGKNLQKREEGGIASKGYTHTTFALPVPGGGLAERLRDRGLKTIAVPYGGATDFFQPGVGFERGFEVYAAPPPNSLRVPSSRRVVQAALRELDAQVGTSTGRKSTAKKQKSPAKSPAKRFFLWIHLFDTHGANGRWSRYRELVGSVDQAFESLVSGLKKRGLWKNTIIVLLADHGESFGEHHNNAHASTLYDEQVRVPLVIRVPRSTPRVIDSPVSTVDVATTLLALSGADTEGLDGTDLWPVIAGLKDPTTRPIITELHRYLSSRGRRTTDLKAVIFGCHKLIYNRKRDDVELYDLCADPGELVNLVAEDPGTTQELIQILAAFLNRAEAEHPLP